MPFKEHNKWGIQEKETTIIPAVYDTIFNFDNNGNVCLACFKHKIASTNKIIKMVTINYTCNYLNKKNQKLSIKTPDNDTCHVFELDKSVVKQLTENPMGFAVMVKKKKYLIDKDFKQLTFKGYHDISFSLDRDFYLSEIADENDILYTGLINSHEQEIIPFRYSKIKLNPIDSLIFACAAGIGNSSDDDVYNYAGKKISSYRRHIDMATKNFIVHRLFEPKEHFIIYNIFTKEEKNLKADEVHFYDHDELLIRIKNDWYVYNLITDQKKSKQL